MIDLLFWLSILLLSTTVVIATAIALVVMPVYPRNTVHISFGAFSISLLIWAFFSAIVRVQLWYLGEVNEVVWSLSILSTTLMFPFLLIFMVRYLKRDTSIADFFSAVVLGQALILILFAPTDSVASNPRLEHGINLVYDLSLIGALSGILLLLLAIWALVLIIREREVKRRLEERLILIGIGILSGGFLLGAISQIPVPLMPFTNLLSVGILGYAVIKRQVFNPLKERTRLLESEIRTRKKAQLELERSEERYRNLTEKAKEGILVVQDAKMMFMNPMALDILEAEKKRKMGFPIFNMIYPEDVPKVKARWQKRISGEPVPSDLTFRIKTDKGNIRWIRTSSVLIEWEGRAATLHFADDITQKLQNDKERKRLRGQLQQQQKLESIGTLASGIAHEINNPLMGIINYAQLIHDDVEEPKLKTYSEAIIKEGDRVSSIVRNLLAFSRQDKETHSPSSIEDVINNSMSLIGAVLRKDQIKVELDIQKDLPNIKCRNPHLQQVIINLLTNARSALNKRYPDHDPDKVVLISARRRKLRGKDHIQVIVEDHGIGIPEDIQDRIFDPFFTTKTKEEGTGLGLSVSYDIVKDHRGRLTVESKAGRYTRFIMDLPVDNGWKL